MGKIIQKVENQVAILTIESPPANALSKSLIEQLDGLLDEIENNTS